MNKLALPVFLAASLLAATPSFAVTLEAAADEASRLTKDFSLKPAADDPPAAQDLREAPDFSLLDVRNLFKGDMRKTTLREFRGKVVLLDFWATWCGPCKEATPTIVDLHKKYATKGLVVIGMNLNEAPDRVKAYVEEHGVEYRVLLDLNANASRAYGVLSIPAFYLIDAEGKIVWQESGYYDGMKPDFEKQIESALKAVNPQSP